jgi:N-acetylglucosaminyl-diphospho-decaprenol L-rhamnosyltransferase
MPVISPLLSGVVVHWGPAELLDELVRSWPQNPRFELVVVDNDGGAAGRLPAGVRRLVPGRNLGFGGGANLGAQAAHGELLLFLNPDAVPEPGALERLIEGFDRFPAAAGLVPRLLGAGGSSQCRWQLRPLPRALHLVAQALFLPLPRGPAREPAEGSPIEQPAAAALALRRGVFAAMGGFDAGFFPAWFEDVDLERRLAGAGHRLVYLPQAAFRHGLGSSVGSLGHGPFLWIYGKNLHRYTRKHHGPRWSALVRVVLPLAALARVAVLPLRRPRRATSRRAAAGALAAAAVGAWSGWRRPAAWVRRLSSPETPV